MSLPSDTARDLARFCRRVVRDEQLPGLSVAVVRDDQTVFADGFGSRDLAGNRPATASTLYGIASCTKSFAGVALLQLAESGMVDLDDPVADYVPFELGAPDDPITIHHVLSHSSGLPSLGVSETLLARRLRLPDPGVPLGDVDDFHAHVNGAGDERTDPPGERFAYCNTGYALAGEVVESLTGKSFDQYVEDHVFEPLGMARATFDDHEFSMDDDHMTQYRTEDGEFVASSLPTRDIGQATGGILAPVDELTQYLRLHLNEGEVDGVHLLDADSLERAHAGHVETPRGEYGYGWFRQGDFLGDRTLLGHSGSITVSSAYLGFLPEAGVGVALGANTSPDFPLGVVGEGVLATLLGEHPNEAVPFFRRRRRHERLTGRYTAYEGVMSAVVEEAGNALRVRFQHPLNRGVKPLLPVAEDAEGAALTTGAADADEVHRYETLGPSGERQPVEFRVDGDDVSLLVDRWHLHRTG